MKARKNPPLMKYCSKLITVGDYTLFALSLSLFFCLSPQLQLKSFVMVGGGESENRKPFLAQLMPSAKGSHWIWSFLYRYQQRQPSVCFPFPLCSISVTFYVSLPFSAD
jgi:hypothetical protein